MNNNSNYDYARVRKCAGGCGRTDENGPLFEIILPPDIPRKTPYCKECMNILIDNDVKRKSHAKRFDK